MGLPRRVVDIEIIASERHRTEQSIVLLLPFLAGISPPLSYARVELLATALSPRPSVSLRHLMVQLRPDDA
jgi:hypothetical protein